jgi:integrase/recombinase XerD
VYVRHTTVNAALLKKSELQAYTEQAKCVDRSYQFFASQKSVKAGFSVKSLSQTIALL